MAPTLLPLNASLGTSAGSPSPMRFVSGGGKFSFPSLRKLTKVGRMDLELAAWQLSYLIISPRRFYRNVYHHKQTKNQWARDDPAMVVLISVALALVAGLWSCVHSYTWTQAFVTTALMIFRDFLLASAAIATLLWYLSNHLLLSPTAHSSPSDSRVEWAFAFDVAVNAFFTFFLWIYVGQLLFVNLITRSNWVCLWLGNSLYLLASAQYIYITYLGYAALPFLSRTELLLAPLLPLLVGYILSLLGFNVARAVLEGYFGQSWH